MNACITTKKRVKGRGQEGWQGWSDFSSCFYFWPMCMYCPFRNNIKKSSNIAYTKNKYSYVLGTTHVLHCIRHTYQITLQLRNNKIKCMFSCILCCLFTWFKTTQNDDNILPLGIGLSAATPGPENRASRQEVQIFIIWPFAGAPVDMCMPERRSLETQKYLQDEHTWIPGSF